MKEKDFNYYVKEYYQRWKIVFEWATFQAILNINNYSSNSDKTFELKIGLLKFICDDVGIKWSFFILEIIYPQTTSKYITEIKNICPKGFLNSLFKNNRDIFN